MSTCRYKYSGDKIHVVKGQGTNRFTNLIYNWDIFVTRSLSFAAFFPNWNQCDLNIYNTITFPEGSGIRNKADTRDDFPAPVRPTTPIFSLS